MRRPFIVAAVLCAAATLLSQSRSFTGEIMDSQCAGMRSHTRMMQGLDVKTAKECTQKCEQDNSRGEH